MRPEFQVGPVKLRRFIVAVKDTGVTSQDGLKTVCHWPDEYGYALEEARARYDAGLVEMIQGREGQVVIQYAIPMIDLKGKTRIQRRRRWFRPQREN